MPYNSTITRKMKVCTGKGVAKDFPGCGEERYPVLYGLCESCKREWLYSTGEGAAYIKKMVIPKAKKKVAKEWRERKKEIKEKIETKSDLEKKLQKEINHIVRLIDKGHPCISSGRPLGKSFDAGHLYSTGSNPQIRFHLFNIFSQSVTDNQWKSGNQLEYAQRLEETFGKEVQEYCLSLNGLPALHLSKEELKEKISIARGQVKWLKLQDRKFTTEERIILRGKINQELGIYEPKFSNFTRKEEAA